MEQNPIEPHRAGLPKVALPELPRTSLRLVLDQVRSAHNTGALFRTADAAAVDFIYLLGLTPHPPHSQLEKTALGATEYVSWRHCEDFREVDSELTADNYTLIGLDNGPGAVNLFEFQWPRNAALVAGHEVEGLSPEIGERCKTRIFLPMYGFKRSLNVTTALGIAIYDYLRTFPPGQG